MNHHYKDIRDKLGTPQWWDECAVPRYCEFAPTQVNDIYADEAALMVIACQSCNKQFLVAMSAAKSHNLFPHVFKTLTIAERITAGSLFYGDPPNAECCPAGPTTTSDSVRVVEYWRRGDGHRWERVDEYEKPLDAFANV